MSPLTKQQHLACLTAKQLSVKSRFYESCNKATGETTKHQHKLILISQRDINKALSVLQPVITSGIIALKEHDVDFSKEMNGAVSSLCKSEQIVTKLIAKMTGGVS